MERHIPVAQPRPKQDTKERCWGQQFCQIKWKCKNICGTQVSRYLFSARSYMVNYVYYLVCLCFGIFGVKYFAYSYISVLFIRIRPSVL